MPLSLVTRTEPLSPVEELDAYEAKLDFKLFLRLAWPVIEPATRLSWNWHLDALAEHLQAVHEHKLTRLLINMPPGHAKSSVVSVLWPMWCWINDPSIRWLCASHSLDLAIRDNRNCRVLIQSDWFQARYGYLFKLAGDQNVKGFFETDQRGYRLATAVRGSSTGKRGGALLIDDANNAMAGQADIEATVDWFSKTWVSRLNDQQKGIMVVVGQRLHQKDLSGHILELGGWEHLNLASEFDPAKRCHTSVISSSDDEYAWKGCDPRTEAGEPLWRARFPKPVLNKLKQSMGEMNYAAQHQQTPVPAGGETFKMAHERLFTVDPEGDTYLLQTPTGVKPVLKSDCWLFTTSDVAIKEKQSADYTVLATWACTPKRDILLLHLVRGHWSHPTQQEQARLVYQQFDSSAYTDMHIEDVAYQSALIQDLLNEGIPCRAFRPHADKLVRATSASTWQANGKIYFLHNAPWLADLRTELYTFPKAGHDDQVDCISMAAKLVRSQIGADDDEEEQAEPGPESMLLVPVAKAERPTIDPFAWADAHGGDW